MAKSTGKYAAYRNIQPLRGNTSDMILDHEDQQFKHRAEQRQIQGIKKGEYDAMMKAQKEEGEALQKTISDATVGDTGWTSHDEPMVDILQKEGGVFDSLTEIEDTLKRDPTNRKAIIKKANLLKSIESMKGYRQGIMDRGIEIEQGINDGSLSASQNKDWRDNYKKLTEGYQYNYKITEDGRIVVDNKGYDPDGDGLPNEITLEDLYDPNKLGGNKNNFDDDAWFNAAKKHFGAKSEKKNLPGYVTKETKGFNYDNLEELNKSIDNTFGSFEEMTDDAKSFIGDTLKGDWKNIDKEEFAAIKKEFANQFISTYETKDFETTNYSAKNSAKNAETSRIKAEKKDNKSVKDSLYSYANRLKSGDKSALAMFENAKAESSGKKKIKDVGYSNGQLVFNVVDEAKGGKTVNVTINTADEDAISKILHYVRPGEKIDKVMDEYDKGKNDEVFEQNTNTLPTKAKMMGIADSIPKKSHEAIPYLEKQGLTGFIDKGSYTPFTAQNNILAPNGELYNVNTDKGMKALQEYIKSDEYKTSIGNKDKDTKDFDPTKF